MRRCVAIAFHVSISGARGSRRGSGHHGSGTKNIRRWRSGLSLVRYCKIGRRSSHFSKQEDLSTAVFPRSRNTLARPPVASVTFRNPFAPRCAT